MTVEQKHETYLDFAAIRGRLRHLEAVVLAGSGGSLRVLAKSGRVAFDLPLRGGEDEETIAKQIEELLSNSTISRPERPIRLCLIVQSEALGLNDTYRALATLVGFLGPQAVAEVLLCFSGPATEWRRALPKIRVLREVVGGNVGIRVTGSFGPVSEDEMELLFALGVGITFEAGCSWLHGGVDLDLEVLRVFATFGFRVPVAWHVHESNIAEIEDKLDGVLASSCCSGFSLPLVSTSPFYRFDEGFPPLPDAAQYCQLLVRSYKRYPHYDDFFFPVNELALLIGNGGRHDGFDAPSFVRVLVGGDGQIGLYRQTPALASAWSNVSEVVRCREDELRHSFWRLVSGEWPWANHSYCRECVWRRICGGLEPPVCDDMATREVDSMCWYRKLFLEHFALARHSDGEGETAQLSDDS